MNILGPITSRKSLIETVYTTFLLDLLETLNEEDEEELVEDFLFVLLCIESQRYINERLPVLKHFTLVGDLLPNYDEKRFRRVTRMSRIQFYKLLQRIENDNVFITTNRKQYPVSIQLLVALSRFGSFGNSASVVAIARNFGLSDGGTLNIFTKRVISSLLNIEKDWIFWPSVPERTGITNAMAQVKFPFCLGFVDGTHVGLSGAPVDDPVSYFNRKGFYSLNLQLIIDPFGRIRAYHVGQPGKVHDSKVFTLMDLNRNPGKYFSEHEYLLGDKAYKLTTTMVTPYRKPKSKQQEKFNYKLSSQRIKIEHANGILKNRFASLKGLRMRITRSSGHRYASEWVVACLILHNMLMEEDPWDI